jgi:hypothetical protein
MVFALLVAVGTRVPLRWTGSINGGFRRRRRRRRSPTSLHMAPSIQGRRLLRYVYYISLRQVLVWPYL